MGGEKGLVPSCRVAKQGMFKVIVIFGTRPEAVKLAPVIKALERHPSMAYRVVVTGQHRQMLDQVIKLFGIKVDHDFNIMEEDQSLLNVVLKSLSLLKEYLEREKPEMVLVQGDTSTTFAASLASYYIGIPVGHVEAGLRTYRKYQPFPEEINRRLTSHLADLHFAPTGRAKENLLREGISEDRIFVTGNTVIDALKLIKKELSKPENREGMVRYFKHQLGFETGDFRLLLVTGHRRENFGENLKNICEALKEVALRNSDVQIVYPVHMNPNVEKPVREMLAGISNIRLLPPLEYLPFVHLMTKAHFILTDSGGIQEEAPSLGKPVLVMREVTERPEVIEAGVAKLVGTKKETICREAQALLDNRRLYESMARAANPYGNGDAALQIAEIVSKASDFERPPVILEKTET
jgi:UDP-N-acetylglucosamine 2-epimerase (non-hydrolysing)